MSDSAGGECVKVVVRCRPMNSREKEIKAVKIVKIDRKNLSVSLVGKPGEEPKTFTYDNVYDDDSLQKDVYDETAFPLVKSVMEGYNGTIFAYGQTGCGKTFTMEGVRASEGKAAPADLRGIIPRTFDQIFEFIAEAGNSGDKKFLVAISYVEIYNEEVRDLLSDNPKTKMDVKEDPEKGVFIKNLSAPEVTSVAQIEALMVKGNKNRSVGATAMNAQSSRSHSLFTVRIETSEAVPGQPDEPRIKAGKLNLVDLAGSERQSKTEATGDRLKEAQKINLSLSALGNVISALVVASGKNAKEAAATFIPYRDSKLTRLLQDSLGGNTKTIMIAACSPAGDSYDETLSTLRYANRAKNIKNKPKVNEDPKDAMLREFQDEIKRLKAMLEQQGIGMDGPSGAPRLKKPKKKKVNADGIEEEESEEESEEEEEEAAPRPKKAKKPKREKKPKPEGEVEDIEDEEEDEEDDEIADETEGGGAKKKKRSSAAGAGAGAGAADSLLSEAEARKLEEARADYEAELSALQAEKAKHEAFAAHLAEQMRATAEEASQRTAQSEAERLAALAEAQERAREKAEHEARARELAEEMQRTKAEEAARLEAHQAEIAHLQSAALNEKLAMKAKLKKLQQKLIDGGRAHKTAAQEAEERARAAAEEAVRLKQQEAREREAKQAVEEEKLLLEESYASLQDEVVGKTRKLKKLRRRLLQLQQEVDDAAKEAEAEKEAILGQARISEREARLYRQICEKLLTKSDLEKIVRGATYDEGKEEWKLPRIDLPVFFPTVRLTPGIGPGASTMAAGKPGTAAAAHVARGNVSTAAGGRPVGSPTAGGKIQEEKVSGPDGWKKSVVHGFDRDEYQPNANGRAVSRAAQQAASTTTMRQPSPSATQHLGQPAPAPPRKLTDGLSGAGARTPRADLTSDEPEDPLAATSHVARRPAFDVGGAPPTAVTSGVGLDVNEVDARVQRKAAFSPSGAPTAAHTASDPLTFTEPAKRAAFSPAGSLAATTSSDAHDSLTTTLQNGPAARAAFNPNPSVLVAGTTDTHDPLAASHLVPKRSAFDPSAVAGGASVAASITPQTSLPADLPAARSFQPASFAASTSQSNPAADLLASHTAALPSRAAFNPNPAALAAATSSAAIADTDALRRAPPPRASFAPAGSFTATHDQHSPLLFPAAPRGNFEPARIG